jgi:hypothetical protein
MFRLTRNLLQWKLITDVDKNKKYGYMATLNFFHIVNLHHIVPTYLIFSSTMLLLFCGK